MLLTFLRNGLGLRELLVDVFRCRRASSYLFLSSLFIFLRPSLTDDPPELSSVVATADEYGLSWLLVLWVPEQLGSGSSATFVSLGTSISESPDRQICSWTLSY